ncbi:hypothetical protein KEJ17_03120, partial [Candidatus Bathyarchaeota archaeon]|nr:hypothetical protein [Candidatus Bathyarchaeota archaeon]
ALSTAITHPKLMKKLTRKKIIFGYRNEGLIHLQKTSLEELVELISTLGILLQTKTYLFWRQETTN